MALLLILPILVSGYLLCLKHPVLYINLHKFEGQLLYLHVARLGMRCLVQAFAVVGIVSALVSHVFNPTCWFEGTKIQLCRTTAWNLDYIEAIGIKVKEWGFAPTSGAADILAFMILVSAVAVMIPFIEPKITMRRMRRKKGISSDDAMKVHLARQATISSPMGSALIEAFVTRTELMLSMDDRKVYVGIMTEISHSSEVSGPNEEITIVPVISGYRDKDTLKVVYTTDYAAKAAANADIRLSPIILRQSNIVSITTFSQVIRKAFDEGNEDQGKQAKVEIPAGASFCIWGGPDGQRSAVKENPVN
ncbi:hypothetical protein [Pseudomonas putida]|uniref:Uncharacterized protein n=1 Tax=Pseudomonas putida TaxID=303 RepID=A0A8I1EA94_PSEPU|nr:hypothetical protein [Pseudomonas putida]MBI6882720.1 hypothetical protein [Pseudomonas putida]